MTTSPLLFLKLGGSLITDKRAVEVVRENVLARIASEIAAARKLRPEMRLIIGHGSGSFGHTAAARYRTRDGVNTIEQWEGFCQVSAAAARLNRHVCEALLSAGIPVVTFQPSASALCDDGQLIEMATGAIDEALQAGLVPLVYGDVAFDHGRGGTIVSTEQVLSYLARKYHPGWLLLAGDTTGVYDLDGRLVPHITTENFALVRQALGGSAGTDVTGGMESKVRGMLALTEVLPGLSIRIFSGLDSGRLRDVLLAPHKPAGTLLSA